MNAQNIPLYADFKQTRNYMQDIAKIVGKMQQAYVAAKEHDWHRGLHTEGNILMSPALEGEAAGKNLAIDFMEGTITTPWGSVDITDKNPKQVQAELQALSPEKFETPEYEDSSCSSYDATYAGIVMALFSDMTDVFEGTSKTIATGKKSPTLIYPHHFDMSLAWFPKDVDEPQITFGFSTGDSSIEEPYLYVLAWPEHQMIEDVDLPEFAGFEMDAFKGIVVKASSLKDIEDPDNQLQKLLQNIVSKIA